MFERGFKTWCERIAADLRKALNVGSTEPLPCERLAAHLGLAVRGVEQIPGLDPVCLRSLLGAHASTWSAVTISNGSKSVIILNTAHSDARSASNLAHELAHVIRRHKPAQVFVAPDGSLLLNTYDRIQEEEAKWLAGCLLLPREALVQIRALRLAEDDAARRYGVSTSMLRYRMQVSGVDVQLARTKSWRRRKTARG